MLELTVTQLSQALTGVTFPASFTRFKDNFDTKALIKNTMLHDKSDISYSIEPAMVPLASVSMIGDLCGASPVDYFIKSDLIP